MLYETNSEHDHDHRQNRFAVIPTSAKLRAGEKYSGSGVRIAFLDSGFYAHPDFKDRIVAFRDTADEESSLEHIFEPAGHHWHGTQTVSVCAGNGILSDGIYAGLAYDAELVLVKISRNGRIGDAEIESGLEWIIENRERLSIRVLNMSLGGDCDIPTANSRINALVEELSASGIVVTVAAGNSAESRSSPPASCPSAITAGGYSDENQFAPDLFDLYHSNYGTTADGIVKPEVIAPAMFVAAPIVPSTRAYREAETLSMLAAAPDYALMSMLEDCWRLAGLNESILDFDLIAARQVIERELRDRKIVATHYQHVDGTSFAAPIIASVAALMLEANPGLTPAAIKNILISTASRIGGRPAIRQGFGVVDINRALDLALIERHTLDGDEFHQPRVIGREIVFTYHNDKAENIRLAGDFNLWNPDDSPFEKCSDGLWRVAINCLPSGRYRYKFVVDDHRWIEDPSHGLKEDDNLGGFNSILVIE